MCWSSTGELNTNSSASSRQPLRGYYRTGYISNTSVFLNFRRLNTSRGMCGAHTHTHTHTHAGTRTNVFLRRTYVVVYSFRTRTIISHGKSYTRDRVLSLRISYTQTECSTCTYTNTNVDKCGHEVR